jgi:hypothetical protein
MEDKLIIDGEGTIVGELHQGDRIIRRHIIEELPEENDRMPFSNGEWGKTYDVSFRKLTKLKLSPVEYRMVLLFFTLVSYSSGLIAHGNYKPVTSEWIENELEITRNTVFKSIKKLMDFRIISQSYSGKEKIYFFNPYIYQKGKYINKTLFEMFKKSEWAKEK